MADADTKEEFLKSYADSWFGVKIEGKTYPCRLADRKATDGVITLKYMVDSSGKLLSKDINWIADRKELIRGYPDLGCVKVGPTVGFVSVRPLRQFKKGYVPDNAVLYVPNHAQIRKVFSRFLVSSGAKDVVWQVFNREYWEVPAALEDMRQGKGVGYPLSTNFGVYIHSEYPNPIIIMRNHDAGVVRDGKVLLFKNFEIFKEQFKRETGTDAGVCE